MLWVRHETDWKPATRNQRLLAVRLLLLEQAEDGLAGLPRGAVIHGSELPRVDPGLPKTIADEVFAQWIDPGEPGAAGGARPDAGAGARVHRLPRLERGDADARRARARPRRPPVPALRQRQVEPGGDAADPAAAGRPARAPRALPGRLVSADEVAVPLAHAPQRDAWRVSRQSELGGQGDRAVCPDGRDPHRRRGACARCAPAPVPPPPRDEHGQREHPADRDRGGARSRLDGDDRPLRTLARSDDQARGHALARADQHPRRADRAPRRRAAGGGRVDEGTDRAAPSKRCRTGTAGCRWCRPARTRTRA